MKRQPANHANNANAGVRSRSLEFDTLAAPNGYFMSVTRLADLDHSMISRWKDLESEAADPNPYLSVDFVIPAAHHLSDPTSLLVIAIDDPDQRLRGIMVIGERPPNSRFPLKHYAIFTSPHSFLGGILIGRSRQRETLDALAYFFRSKAAKYQALYIDGLYTQSVLHEYLSEHPTLGIYRHDSYRRAVIDLSKTGRKLISEVERKRVKDLERCRRNLAKLGKYHWRLIEGESISDQSVASFLSLEHSGWKGEHGTSILSSKSEELFFLTMVRNLSVSGKIFFTEILLDDTIIASTCNFRIGDKVFAFKVAWDIDYRSFSPGMLNEYEFLHYLDQQEGAILYVDSGSSHDSYIERLWPDRAHIVNGYCLFSRPLIYMANLLSITRATLRASRNLGRQLTTTIARRGRKWKLFPTKLS